MLMIPPMATSRQESNPELPLKIFLKTGTA
jgi:hypothetical protein